MRRNSLQQQRSHHVLVMIIFALLGLLQTTHAQNCDLCGDPSLTITSPDVVVSIDTQADRTCLQYDTFNNDGQILPENCATLSGFIQDQCTCGPVGGNPVDPTESPIPPTEAPIVEDPPTDAPDPPTDAPTETPVADPTAAPISSTEAPTAVPVPDPTEAPVAAPSSSPTMVPPPTMAPIVESMAPTIPEPEPTLAPVNATDAPTAAVTDAPTEESAVTDAPTEQEVIVVPPPTRAPVAASSEAPTETITESPTVGEDEGDDPLTATIDNLQMRLNGLSELSGNDRSQWEEVTSQYFVEFYRTNADLGVQDVVSSITVNSVEEVPDFRRQLRTSRQLQGGDEPAVMVSYDQTVEYVTADADFTAAEIVSRPFEGNNQAGYLFTLVSEEDSVLADITGTEQLTEADIEEPVESPTLEPVVGTMAPSSSPEGGKDRKLSTPAIIGIAVAAGALFFGTLLYCFFTGADRDEYDQQRPPPEAIGIKPGGDEVSTLAAPNVGGGRGADPSLGGYGEESVATVDYDYSKAYGGGGDTSVSSAGGTFGSNGQNNQNSLLDPARAAASGAALGGFADADPDSFDNHQYQERNNRTKDELLNVFAPPGKLGVVIDTPDDGAPVVHAVKDTSVIADKIQVGDNLVAVDDEDVRTMTAIKVSKLISRKSANPSRKLTILRRSPVQ